MLGRKRECYPLNYYVSATSAHGPKRPVVGGQSMSALPGKFRRYLFCYRERVVDLNSQISNSAFDFGVPQKKLYGSQVASAPVDEGRLGSAQ